MRKSSLPEKLTYTQILVFAANHLRTERDKEQKQIEKARAVDPALAEQIAALSPFETWLEKLEMLYKIETGNDWDLR